MLFCQAPSFLPYLSAHQARYPINQTIGWKRLPGHSTPSSLHFIRGRRY